MKNLNIILLIVLILDILIIVFDHVYVFAGGSAVLIICYFAMQLIGLIKLDND